MHRRSPRLLCPALPVALEGSNAEMGNVSMAVAALCTSHSPLMDFTDPGEPVREAVNAAFVAGRRFIEEFRPDLVVLFGPDHYNGFFYDMMPPFCIGTAATSIGDYRSIPGELSVDRDAARVLTRGVLASGLDLAMSEQIYVDHGFAQPLEILFGGIDRIPVVPIFVNCLAEPLGPAARAVILGRAIGQAALELDRRILFMGSGGLSHDPPAPRLETASPEVVERIISSGRHLSPDERARREMASIQAGRDLAAGTAAIQPLNPEWDRSFLESIQCGDLDLIAARPNELWVKEAGHSSHEARTWLAAHAALGVSGPYESKIHHYQAIPEWIVGFALAEARLVGDTWTLEASE